MSKAAAFFFWLFLAVIVHGMAWGQPSPPPGIVRSGSVTTGHCVQWAGVNAVSDAGAACASGGAVSVTGTTGVVITPSPGTGTFAVGQDFTIIPKYTGTPVSGNCAAWSGTATLADAGNTCTLPSLVTSFASSGTWTKNSKTVLVRILLMGGGGSGGGGGVALGGTVVSGGGGGGVGATRDTGILTAALFSSPATVTIGSTAAGGPGSIGVGSGANGAVGGHAAIAFSTGTITAFGGGGGGGGSLTGATGGAGASDNADGATASTSTTTGTTAYYGGSAGTIGGNGVTMTGNNAAGAPGGVGSPITTATPGVGTPAAIYFGGCSGGGNTFGGTANAGGQAGGTTFVAGPAGGTAGGGAGQAALRNLSLYATGASGGGANIAGTGGAGGAGAFKASCGGGGGASTTTGGAGGTGGSPNVTIEEFF